MRGDSMSKVLIDIDLKRIRGLIDLFGGSGSEEFEDYNEENARDEFKDMLHLIYAGQEIVGSMNEWQPIGIAPKHDKLEDSVNILVFRGNEGFEEKIITIENSINYRYYKWNGFTHWMPLPNPPKQEKEIV